MKTFVFLIIFSFSCFIANALNQDPGRYNTEGLMNGYFWTEVMSENEKLMFIAGWQEGIMYGVVTYDLGIHNGIPDDRAGKMTNYYKNTCSQGDLVRAVNIYYSDPANRKTPISLAITYSIHKIK